MVAVHQFVPTLAPRDAVSGHYMRGADGAARRRVRLRHLRDGRAGRAREGGEAVPDLSRRPAGRTDVALLPLVDRLTGRRLRRRATRAVDRRLPQHHARGVLRPLGTRRRGVPARRAPAAAQPRAARRRSGSPTPRTTPRSSTSSASARRAWCRSCSTATTCTSTIDAATRDRLAAERPAGSSTWLFVGQVAPHKAQHDIVKALAAYRRGLRSERAAADRRLRARRSRTCGRSRATSTISGSPTRSTSPAACPTRCSARTSRPSDVYVCLSEHEGFCVPLLEAMHHNVPVVAYGAGAVPETLGDGGLAARPQGPAHGRDRGRARDGRRSDERRCRRDARRVDERGTRAARRRSTLARSEATLRDAVASVAGTP